MNFIKKIRSSLLNLLIFIAFSPAFLLLQSCKGAFDTAGINAGMADESSAALNITTGAASVNPATASSGGTVNINTTVTSDQDILQAHVSLFFKTSSGGFFSNSVINLQTDLVADKPYSVIWNYVVANDVPSGTYSIELDVFSADYQTAYYVNKNFASLTVTGGAAATPTPTPVPTGTPGKLVKFNPGQWVNFTPDHGGDVWGYDIRDQTVFNSIMSFIDSIKGTGIKGIAIGAGMSSLEPTYGNYNFTQLDAIINKLASQGQRLIIGMVTETQFLNEHGFPQYMLDDRPTYFAGRYANNQYEDILRWWQPIPRGRLIALYQAIGARYNSNANLEGLILTGELSFSAYLYNNSSEDSSYNYENAKAGWKLLAEAWHTAAPNTMGAQWYNDFKNDTLETAQEYYAIATANNVMWMNPNSVHNNADVSQTSSVGMDYLGRIPGQGSALINYSLRMPMAAAGSDSNDFYAYNSHGDPSPFGPPYQSLAVQWADKTLAHSVNNYPHNDNPNAPQTVTVPFNNASHFLWFVNRGQGGDSTNMWDTAEKAFIISKIGAEPAYTIPTCLGANAAIGSAWSFGK